MIEQKSQNVGTPGKAASDRQSGQQYGDLGRHEAPKIQPGQAPSPGQEFKGPASGFVETASEKLRERSSGLGDMAKDVAAQASDKLKGTMSDAKAAGADCVSNIAETIRRAADHFEEDIPVAGEYIRKVAAQIEMVSDSVRTGDVNELLANAQNFARRQPAMSIGLAALIGFAAVRFLKSSSETNSARRAEGQSSQIQHG